jgi:hypothetical protein
MDEAVIDSPRVMAAMPRYLEERLGVTFTWDTAITGVKHPHVYSG